MDLELDGRVAVVTGASKGIGLAVVRTLLEEGARVAASSRSSTPELEALGGDLVHIPADLMDRHAPAEIIAGAVERFGGVDILVNNAGGPPLAPRCPSSGSSASATQGGARCSNSTCSRPYARVAPRFH